MNAKQIAVVVLALLTGCVEQGSQPQVSELLGSWKTGTVQTEWGASVLEVTFQSASDIEFKMTFPDNEQSIVGKGKFRLDGKRLISDAINKGEPVSVWLESGELVIHTPPEPPQRFTRNKRSALP